MKKKTVALLLALVLVFGAAIGGTIAYLTAETGPVTNTFTVGKVAITLDEKDTDGSSNGNRDTANAYQLIPGTTYEKDPTVTVTDGSEDCYLFVKFEEKNGASTYLDYTSKLTTTDGWTRGDGTSIPDNVWYRVVNKTDTNRSFKLLVGNDTYRDGCITVKADAVTNENMTDAAEAQLVYTAYACQMANVSSAAAAWATVKPTVTP